MAISRAKKESIVAKVKDSFARAKSLAFVRFHGLSVAKLSEMRKVAKASDGEVSVAKKTLVSIALKESGKEIPEKLEGEVGLVYGYADELGAFSLASGFCKAEKDAVSLLGGFSNGGWVDMDTAKRLGAIPSRNALIAQFMSVLVGNHRKLVNVLDKIKGQKEANQPAG